MQSNTEFENKNNNVNNNAIGNDVTEKLRNKTDNIKNKKLSLQLEIDKENPCCKT
jgi:hypothetical protein